MEKFKVKVTNKSEVLEIEKTLSTIGMVSSNYSGFSYPKYIANNIDGEFSDYTMTDSVIDNFKLITIQELRDMVVLKRNSVGDATHKCLWDVNPEYYIDSKGSVYFYKRELDTSFWVKTVNSKDWCDKSLKPIKEEVMKEYLEKQADGSYKIMVRGIDGKNGDIEVPDGADCARNTSDGLEFYKDNLNLFFLSAVIVGKIQYLQKKSYHGTLYGNATHNPKNCLSWIRYLSSSMILARHR